MQKTSIDGQTSKNFDALIKLIRGLERDAHLAASYHTLDESIKVYDKLFAVSQIYRSTEIELRDKSSVSFCRH